MNNLNIFADATLDSGAYGNVRVFGSATVNGDVTVQSMQIFGSSHFSGQCQIDQLKVFGSCDFNGDVEVKNMDIKGSADFNENVKVDYVKIYGSVKFNKQLSRSKEVSIYGDVTISTLEADHITVKGYVKCDGVINGENIEISSQSGSKIKEMVGTEIKIKPNHKWFTFNYKPVEVDTIEGDNIYLENVIATVVRGKTIVVGPNCQIDTIEYQENCNVNNHSKVKKIDKI